MRINPTKLLTANTYLLKFGYAVPSCYLLIVEITAGETKQVCFACTYRHERERLPNRS